MRLSFSVPLHNAIAAIFLTALAPSAATAQENVWTSHGPTDVGWVNDLALTDSVAYAATLNGVFRSDDGGVSWRQSGLAGEGIFQIVARPGTDVVLAAAYGYDSNLHASRDGGETWASISGLPTVTAAAIDPGHLSTLYAGTTEATIWKSADAGASWQQLSTTPGDTGAWALAFAFDSRAMYVLTDRSLYKSLDGGVNWTDVQPPVGIPNSIATGAAAGVVYAAGSGSFCWSADSAATWTCSTSFATYYTSRIVEVPRVSPATPRLLGSSPDGVFLSSDGGATWTPVGEGLDGRLSALGSDASGSLVLAGTATQVFRSQDRGDSWTPSSAGLQSMRIDALALDPHNPSTVWAGGLGNYLSGPDLFRSVDSGLSWSPAGGPQGPRGVNALAIDPDHPLTMYAGSWNAVFRTENGGQTWMSSVPDPVQGLNVIALDPDSPQRVWAGSHSGLFRSDDGGRTWESAIAQGVYCILFDDRRPGTIYAGSYFDVDLDYNQISGGSIFVSHDNGASFTKGTHSFGTPVESIAADPFEEDVLYVGSLSGVLRSVDGGVTWESASAGLPFFPYVLHLAADPVTPGRMYASSLRGVFRTLDGARTWHPFSSGLGSLGVLRLVISPDGKRLHAATNGGGVFELDLVTEVPSFPCVPSATRLCLVENRYAVELMASRRGEVPNDPGAAQPLSDRSGYFGFPFATGDPEFPEVVVKMLADGAFGAGGAPIFYSSLTTLPYVLTVTDTVTGLAEFYASDPGAPLCGSTELLFGALEASMSLRAAPASAGETKLRLLDGRFSVTLEARNPRTGLTVTGLAMSQGDRFGFFSLPELTGDAQFPEVVVKMVDFRPLSGKFWFFYTGLTGLDYTLTLTDSVTGAVRTYGSPGSFCGGADTGLPSTEAVEP